MLGSGNTNNKIYVLLPPGIDKLEMCEREHCDFYNLTQPDKGDVSHLQKVLPLL